jgi:hypothetical protein
VALKGFIPLAYDAKVRSSKHLATMESNTMATNTLISKLRTKKFYNIGP